MATPPAVERHLPHFHRRAPVKERVRVATTANITIATALNNGDTLDGVTLATGDRVLVKDQSTGSQNGIYEVGASPARAYDMDTADQVVGTIVYVEGGSTNGGKLFKNTNTGTVTLGSTALTFAEFSASVSFATPAIVLGTAAAAGAAPTAIRSDSTIVAFDATAPTTQALGDSAAAGSAAVAARRDHKHAMPALSTATPIVASGSGAAGTAVPSSREDHVHPASAGSGTLTTIEEVDGSPTDSAVTKLVFPNGTLAIAAHVATYTPSGGGGGPSDYVSGASGSGQIIIPGLAGSADLPVGGGSDDEYDATDTSDPLTGWTTHGSFTAMDTNSTVKSHLYLESAAAALGMNCILKAKTPPFTWTVELEEYVAIGANARAQIAIFEASPGKLVSWGWAGNNSVPGYLISDAWNSRTSYNTTVIGLSPGFAVRYLRIIVTSSTDVTFWAALKGKKFIQYGGSYNPGFTVGAAGYAMEGHTSGQSAKLLSDWGRFT